MPTFSYLAIDDLGRSHRGEQEAASESALEAWLKQQGQWLAEAAVVGGTPTGTGNRKVPSRVLIEFFLQLGIQLKEGIPILSALSFGAQEGTHAGFQHIQRDLLERVRAGGTLSDAMSAHPKTFVPLVINLVRAGERSGKLMEMCREIHRYYEWADRLKSDIRQALVYPASVFICTMLLMLLVFTFVVPKFTTMLSGLNVPLPFLTRAVMGASHFITHDGWMAGIGGVLAFAAFKLTVRHSPAFTLFLDRFKLALPVFGPLVWMICLSRFTQNLSLLLRAGVPLLDALAMTRSLVGNQVFERAIVKIEHGVNSGRQIHETMATESIFSRLVVRLVQVGETTGSLGESLLNAADFYNDTLPRQVKKLFSVIEPMIIIMLLIMVGCIAGAIFLPIISLLGGGG